ncbi:MAG: YHYH protein, partial [Chloroflexota bacterium]
CQGHPEGTGQYHYHDISTCLTLSDAGGAHSPLVGYAFDGFGLYGHYGQNGATITDADLDECHGHTHEVSWDGNSVEIYHYHATWEYPYTVGCFRGMSLEPSPGDGDGAPQGQPTAPGQGQGPDLAAAAAQLGITETQLRDALGPPPPDLAAAAGRLGLTEAQLRAALGVP